MIIIRCDLARATIQPISLEIKRANEAGLPYAIVTWHIPCTGLLTRPQSKPFAGHRTPPGPAGLASEARHTAHHAMQRQRCLAATCLILLDTLLIHPCDACCMLGIIRAMTGTIDTCSAGRYHQSSCTKFCL